MTNYMLSGKITLICSITGCNKKILLNKMRYYWEPDTHIRSNIKIELFLFSYATKSDVEKAAGVDPSKSGKKADLNTLKSDDDQLDIDELKAISH